MMTRAAPPILPEPAPSRGRKGLLPEVVSIDVLRHGWPIQCLGPRHYERKRVQIRLPSLPPGSKPVRILHVTDLHFRHRWSRGYDDLIAHTRLDPPDLIFFTGDFVDDKIDHRPAIPLAERLVTGMEARQGKFAIIGNHDGELLLPYLPRWGVTYVGERRVVIPIGDGIEVIGLPGGDREDLSHAFLEEQPSRDPDLPRIVLSHFPDEVRRVASTLRPDLYLAGHTHGGQICLPGRRALITHDSLPSHMCSGVHQVENTILVVNRGMGFSKLPMRIFCPSETIEIVLVPAE